MTDESNDWTGSSAEEQNWGEDVPPVQHPQAGWKLCKIHVSRTWPFLLNFFLGLFAWTLRQCHEQRTWRRLYIDEDGQKEVPHCLCHMWEPPRNGRLVGGQGCRFINYRIATSQNYVYSYM